MAASTYPASLPCPTALSLQSSERRSLSSIAGPRKSRVSSTDRLASVPLNFVFFSAAQVSVFSDWVRTSLAYAGAWFSADWPTPQGGTNVYRFVGTPSYPEFLGNGRGWRVSAQVQLRGRGMPPQVSCDPFYASVELLIPFDGSFNDKSAKHHSVLVDGPVITTDALVGTGAGDFSGGGSISTSPFTISGDFTMEVAVKCDLTSVQPIWIFDTGGPPYFYGAASTNNGTSLDFSWNILGNTLSSTGAPYLPNVWYRTAVSKNGSAIRVFVDGDLISTINPATDVSISALGIQIGGPYSGIAGMNAFHGLMDQLRLTVGAGRYTESYEVDPNGFAVRAC